MFRLHRTAGLEFCTLGLASVVFAGILGLPASSRAICLDPPGDLNGDGEASVIDTQCNILMNLWSVAGQTGEVPTCLKPGSVPTITPDHNCDLVINVSDTVLAIAFALDFALSPAVDADGDQCVDACQSDLDEDGDQDLTDCAPLDPFVGSLAPELCNGFDDNCNGLIDEPNAMTVGMSCDNSNACDGLETCAEAPPAAGVVISELMIDPTVVSDSVGEWVELANSSAVPVNIRGWTLSDDNGDEVIIDPGGALFIRSRATLTLGRGSDPSTSGGALIRYTYSNMTLDNTADSVILRDAQGNLVDRVDYGGSFPLQAGASLARRSLDLDSVLPSSWAASAAVFGDGDKGTPLGPNFDVAVDTCLGGQPLDCDDGNPCTTDTCDQDTGCVNTPNSAPCDDGIACTFGDVCAGGSCTSGVPQSCDDGNPCTADACDTALGCAHTPKSGACDDGNACTLGDVCAGGSCTSGAPKSCDDGNPCTADACDPALGCVYTPKSGACDDGNACTFGEACVGGACTGGISLDCDDGSPCTTDGCSPALGCVYANKSGPCTDGNACTFNDTCLAGVCKPGSPLFCEDGNICTDDFCNPAIGCQPFFNSKPCNDGNVCTLGDQCSSGSCVGASAPNCGDGNPCTDDFCDPVSGCQNVTNSDPCSDGNACTANDACSGGACASGPPANCNDANPCTEDSCGEATGCAHNAVGGACDDGNQCTAGEFCTSGSCGGGTSINCDDANPCTDDTCDALQGCVHTPNAGSCNDSNACTLTDQCAGGACVGSGAPDCGDSNPCTDDSCAPAIGCVHTANSAPCDDGSSCTSGDQCVGGACQGGQVTCNDGNPCTDDVCSPGGGCAYPANSATCDDGNPCTSNDKCAGGSCVGGPVGNCDDGNPCTTDSCNPASGCQNVPNTASCSDGNVCTTNDACSNGTCAGGPALACNDGNPCTNDGCNPVTGCTTTNNSNSCNDNNACTTTDVCQNGSCVGSGAPNCNDNNPCTDDFCAAPGGCAHSPNFAPCNDGNACTFSDTCGGGSCQPGSPVSCNDGSNCTNDSCNPATGCVYSGGGGECSPGQQQTQACGNCGSMSRSCTSNCQWGSYGNCTGQGECAPGSTSSAGCAPCQTRTCQSNCTFPAGGCTGCGGCSTFNQCGLGGCGSGFHSKSYSYSSSCGSCCNNNRTQCEPSCGSQFTQCGLGGCGAGYHSKSYSYSSACGSCCNNNQTTCEVSAGSQFSQCGLGGCPAGYHPKSYSYSSACGSCCNNNQTTCELDSGSSFNKCGLGGCPSGYHQASFFYSSACGSCCNNNATRCDKN